LPESRKHVEDAEGEHLHHLPPHYDIKLFSLQGLLLKLATFVVEEVIYQNVKKKVPKTIPRCCNRRRRIRGQKTETCSK
jgi:hypothetical protein